MKTTEITFRGTTATVMTRGATKHVRDFDALTGSGRGYAGNLTPYATAAKRWHTPAWERFRAALGARDVAAIVKTAALLRSVIVRLNTSSPGDPNTGLTVTHGSHMLFVAPVVGA